MLHQRQWKAFKRIRVFCLAKEQRKRWPDAGVEKGGLGETPPQSNEVVMRETVTTVYHMQRKEQERLGGI